MQTTIQCALNPKSKLFEAVVSSKKNMNSIINFLDTDTMLNVALSSKSMHRLVTSNFAFYEVIERKLGKSIGQLLFLNEYAWILKNKAKVKEVLKALDIYFEKYYKFQSKIATVWSILFFSLVLNCFPYLLACQQENIIHIVDYKEQWKITLPLSVFWFISLVTLIIVTVKRIKFDSLLKEIIAVKLKEIEICSENRVNYVLKELEIKYKNKLTFTFMKYMIAYILFFIPFLLNSNFLRTDQFKNNELFSLGSMILFGSFYLKGLYNLLKRKAIVGTEDKIDKYKSLVKRLKNDFLLEKLNNEVLIHQK